MAKSPKVFVKKIESYTQSNVKNMIENVIGKNKKYKTVLIKPNFCTMITQKGATTNPDLLKHVIRYFKKISKKVIVIESDTIRESFEEVVENLGIVEMIKEEGAELVNLSREKEYDYFKKPFLKHDLLVNLPVLKTHEFTLFTGAIKNMFGLVPYKRRMKHHPKLFESLFKIYKQYEKQVVIMDGLYGMEGNGPTRGTTVKMNIMLSSESPIAIDVVSTKIIGLNPNLIELTNFFKKEADYKGEEIVFKGEFKKIIRKFKLPEIDPITRVKIWIWRKSLLNNFFFISKFYNVTRFFGINSRKVIRKILKMQNIDGER